MENEKEVSATNETVVEEEKNKVENSTTDTSKVDENETDDEVDFDDLLEEDEEETKSTENEDEKSTKKQSSKTNKYYAQKRREEEAKKHEKEIEQKGYYRGVKESIGGINPYTREKIESDSDLETYFLMKEMESKGLDPNDTKDYLKYTREKAEQERIAQEEQERKNKESLAKANETATKNFEEFKAKYPDVKIKEVLDNQNANAIIRGQIALGKSLVEAYEFYNTFVNQPVLDKAEKIATKQAQIAQTIVGSQTEGDTSSSQPDVSKLQAGTKEFKAYVERVKRGEA